jgi:hypothetical protein
MTSPNVPRNAYTDAPEQHPNLILGSLQLLFWLLVRPSAWRNHLKRIEPALDTKSKSKTRLRWQNPALWKLLIQEFLILPVLANSIVVLPVLWLLSMPIQKIASGVALGVPLGLALSLIFVILGLPSGVALGMAFGVLSGVLSGVVSGGMASGVVFALAIVWFGVMLRLTLGGEASSVLWILLSSVFWSLLLGVAWGVTLGVVSGIAWGALFGVGITINLWLPAVLSPFLTGWNILLYQLDKRLTTNKPSFLRWHSAFWNEWQLLPLKGLDQHVLLVIERNPEEGKAALKYLSTSRQRWAAQAVQIELDARGLERCEDVGAIRNAYHNLARGELNSPVSFILSPDFL